MTDELERVKFGVSKGIVSQDFESFLPASVHGIVHYYRLRKDQDGRPTYPLGFNTVI